MDSQPEHGVPKVLGLSIRASTLLAILLAGSFVIPLTLWFAGTGHSAIPELVALILFCLSFAWSNLSISKWQRCIQRLGQSPPVGSLLGPPPGDSDELLAWQWGRQFLYSLLAVALMMLHSE